MWHGGGWHGGGGGWGADLAYQSHTGTFAWQIPRAVFYNLLPVIYEM